MRKDVQEVADILIRHLGFRYAGDMTGTGHHVMVHRKGQMTLPATPHGGNRWRENAIAQAERLSGKRVPRPNSGKRRSVRLQRAQMEMTEFERRMSSASERLSSEWEALAARWDEAIASERVDDARTVIGELARVEELLRRAYKPCPHGTWRIPDTYFDGEET